MDETEEVTPTLLSAAEQFVRAALANADGSHDWWHVSRVRATAVSLAQEEGLLDGQQRLVELAALLHDVEDYKYSGSETANAAAVKAFLSSQHVCAPLIEQVAAIIASVGFKDELGDGSGVRQLLSPAAAIVQDADRLDAIGAVGIARCFTFGGQFRRTLYDPAVPPRDGLSKEQYVTGAAKSTTLNHFTEKLLKLKDLMKTESGRRRAQGRHDVMVAYLHQFQQEAAGQA